MVITIDDKPLIEPYSIYIPEVSFETLLKFATEDISCELLDGVLVIRSPASFLHESIFSFLNTVLRIFGTAHSLGIPVGSRFMIKLSEKWAPEPDLMFLTFEDQKNLKENYFIGPPSVVFEILSKTTRNDDIEKKLPQYLKFGVKEVWLIDPEKKCVMLHWSDSSETYYQDAWVHSKIILGFKIRVSWLWTPNSYSIPDILQEIDESEKK